LTATAAPVDSNQARAFAFDIPCSYEDRAITGAAQNVGLDRYPRILSRDSDGAVRSNENKILVATRISAYNVVMCRKVPPLPESHQSEHDRFKRFARAVLADPKSEVATWEQLRARLKAEKLDIESQIAAMKQAPEKRK
jgi:hypothetical protein